MPIYCLRCKADIGLGQSCTCEDDEIDRLRAEIDDWVNKYSEAKNQLDCAVGYSNRLRVALQKLIKSIEDWERSVEKIIGKIPRTYIQLDEARQALDGERGGNDGNKETDS